MVQLVDRAVVVVVCHMYRDRIEAGEHHSDLALVGCHLARLGFGVGRAFRILEQKYRIKDRGERDDFGMLTIQIVKQEMQLVLVIAAPVDFN